MSNVQKLRRLESAYFAQYGRYASPQEIADYSSAEQQRYDLSREFLDSSRKRNNISGLRHPLSVAEVQTAIAADTARRFIYLDAPITSEKDSALFGSFQTAPSDEESQPDSLLFIGELRDIVSSLIGSLNFDPREKRLIQARLFTEEDPLSLDTLGKEFGVSRERIRQIEKKLLRKLSFRLNDLGYSASDFL